MQPSLLSLLESSSQLLGVNRSVADCPVRKGVPTVRTRIDHCNNYMVQVQVMPLLPSSPRSTQPASTKLQNRQLISSLRTRTPNSVSTPYLH